MQPTHNRGSTIAPPVTIAAVRAGSPAAAAGIEAGERLVSIAGAPVRDYVDYKFHSADERVEVEVENTNGARRIIAIEKHPDQDLGLEFSTDTFDGIRRCCNRCLFCFYDQLPRGLRESLYVRDDDFRLSFLHGNFITLTNLSEEDFTRICDQRLSPLYVSVHATDLALRRRLLGNPSAPDVLGQIGRLADCGIEMHAQVVLCPGVNDGEALERTVTNLASLHPAVASLAIVPVGLTRHRAGLPELRPVDAAAARDLLRRVRAWQGGFRDRLGTRFVFAADEFYLLADEHFPVRDEYEGFPQRDNGVGLTRLFLNEIENADSRPAAGMSVTLVTGTAARDLVERLAAHLREHGARAQVVAVPNRLLGETVTVAGLLAGEDIVRACGDRELGDVVVVPSSALRDGEFLDSMTVEEFSRGLEKRIVSAAGPQELVERLARLRRKTNPASSANPVAS